VISSIGSLLLQVPKAPLLSASLRPIVNARRW